MKITCQHITVTNPKSLSIWEKDLTDGQMDLILEKLHGCKPNNWWYGLIVPMRTQTVHDFALDLFCPASSRVFPLGYNDFLKNRDCSSFYVGAVLGVGSIALDLSSLPIRFLTAVPMIFYRALEEIHPLQAYLQTLDAPKQLFREKYVKIRVSYEYNFEGTHHKCWLEKDIHLALMTEWDYARYVNSSETTSRI